VKNLLKCLTMFMLFTLSLFAQRNNAEFRATWVITWEHISGSSTAEQNKARIRQILDNHKAANMNAVLFQVRQSGTAYYSSSYEPWGYYAGSQYPGFDPLAYAVEEAHKRGLEIHAWFNVFQTSSTASGTLANLHPEWICRDRDGIPMSESRCASPGLQAVRDYTLQVAMEIVRNYDIDGLHLDYIRWNEYSNSKTSKSLAKRAEQENWLDGMVTDEMLADLEKNKAGRYLYDIDHPYSAGVPSGFGSWEEWWRWSVTTFVKTLHDSMQTTKPWVRLSVAALGKYNWSGWQGYGSVYQDAALWFNEGYIDQLTPMSYHWTTGSGFMDMLQTGGTESWGYWLQKGIGAGRLFSTGPGSYILDKQKIWDRHPEIVNTVRTIPWVDGFQFFSYGSWNGHQYWPEAGRTFFGQKTKLRATGLIDNTPPNAPTSSIQKIDSLNYRITVTPTLKGQNQWYLIYRSEDEVVNPQNDLIVDRHFGSEVYSFTDTYTGTQDFNGKYYYAATALDRFWNESSASNAVSTDPVPSFAPVVLNHTPVHNAVVPVTASITITFSKTINTATFASALAIEPAVTFGTTTWSADQRTVTVKFAAPLAFGTTYTVTLNPTLLDVNGRALDGNGDGNAGDALSFQFTTFNVDLTGPQVESTFPGIVDELDIESPVTVVFDEIVKPASVNSMSVLLSSEGKSLTIEPLLTTINNKSVLSLRSYAMLQSDVENNLTLTTAITDTLDNPLANEFSLNFHTANYHYTDKVMIDDFLGSGAWQAPSYSGSTVGIIASECEFGYSTTVFVPGLTFDAAKKKAAYLKYKWDIAAASNLIREHINTSTPTSINIDTSYIIQCYVFGDGSGNLFNFSLYEKKADGTNTGDIIEVGPWTPVDWLGWKLVEWNLSDSTQVGSFISGHNNMDGHHYVLDGLLLKKDTNSAVSGRIYFDELRLVKRIPGQPAPNTAPQISALPDTSVQSGKQITIKPKYTDPDNDAHQIICLSDTSGVFFKIMGHTSGSTVYVKTVSGYVGVATVNVIVKDFGVGELSDTVTFKLTVTPASGIDDGILPLSYQLDQNYPNPFNPTTTIRFTLPLNTQVRMVIYDLLGRELFELVNERMNAGQHTVVFDASSLPSGQYIYQLITDDKILTRKLVLIK